MSSSSSSTSPLPSVALEPTTVPSSSTASTHPPSDSLSVSAVDDAAFHADLVIRATLCQQAERWDDLLDVMKQRVEQSTRALTFVERCLFSLAVKRVVAPLRASWRILITRESLLLSPSPPPSPPRELPLLSAYRLSVQSELLSRLDELLLLLSSHLLPPLHAKLHRELQLLTLDVVSRYSGRPLPPHGGSAEEGRGGGGGSEQVEDEVRGFLQQLNGKIAFVQALAESDAAGALVLYHKMAGDLRRYQSELSPSSERTRALHSLHAHVSYSVASCLSSLLLLPPQSPAVLSLALNRAVFEYEVMMQPERAMRIAKDAYDRAVGGEGREGGGGGATPPTPHSATATSSSACSSRTSHSGLRSRDTRSRCLYTTADRLLVSLLRSLRERRCVLFGGCGPWLRGAAQLPLERAERIAEKRTHRPGQRALPGGQFLHVRGQLLDGERGGAFDGCGARGVGHHSVADVHRVQGVGPRALLQTGGAREAVRGSRGEGEEVSGSAWGRWEAL